MHSEATSIFGPVVSADAETLPSPVLPAAGRSEITTIQKPVIPKDPGTSLLSVPSACAQNHKRRHGLPPRRPSDLRVLFLQDADLQQLLRASRQHFSTIIDKRTLLAEAEQYLQSMACETHGTADFGMHVFARDCIGSLTGMRRLQDIATAWKSLPDYKRYWYEVRAEEDNGGNGSIHDSDTSNSLGDFDDADDDDDDNCWRSVHDPGWQAQYFGGTGASGRMRPREPFPAGSPSTADGEAPRDALPAAGSSGFGAGGWMRPREPLPLRPPSTAEEEAPREALPAAGSIRNEEQAQARLPPSTRFREG